MPTPAFSAPISPLPSASTSASPRTRTTSTLAMNAEQKKHTRRFRFEQAAAALRQEREEALLKPGSAEPALPQLPDIEGGDVEGVDVVGDVPEPLPELGDPQLASPASVEWAEESMRAEQGVEGEQQQATAPWAAKVASDFAAPAAAPETKVAPVEVPPKGVEAQSGAARTAAEVGGAQDRFTGSAVSQPAPTVGAPATAAPETSPGSDDARPVEELSTGEDAPENPIMSFFRKVFRVGKKEESAQNK